MDAPQITKQINVNARKMSYIDRSQRNDYRTYPVVNLQISDPNMIKELLKGQGLESKDEEDTQTQETEKHDGVITS